MLALRSGCKYGRSFTRSPGPMPLTYCFTGWWPSTCLQPGGWGIPALQKFLWAKGLRVKSMDILLLPFLKKIILLLSYCLISQQIAIPKLLGARAQIFGGSQTPLLSSLTPNPSAKPVASPFKIQSESDHCSSPLWLPPWSKAALPAPGFTISLLTGYSFHTCPPRVSAPHTCGDF